MKIKKINIFVASILISLTGVCTLAYAEGKTITMCVRQNGLVYIIGKDFKRDECRKNDQLISWNPLVVVDNDYTPMTDAALLPIGKIHEANYGMHLGYANDTKKVGVHVYIYKKVADYVDRFFLKDVRVKSYDRI